jgi:hypothetical protein
MRKGIVIFVLLAALFAAARFWGLGDCCLDCDEIFSLKFARLSWSDLFTAVADDVSHPPLFYLLLKGWIDIGGESVYWLRMNPALTAIACVGPLLLFCRALRLSWAETNIAIALLAVNGFLIGFAQQLRMFDLLQFFALCSLWMFARFATSPPGDRDNLTGLTLFNVLLVYSHYWGWVLIGTEGLYLLLSRRVKVLPFAVGVLVTAACFVPWVVAVARAAVHHGSAVTQIHWIGVPGWTDLAEFYAKLIGEFPLAESTVVGLALFGVPIMYWAGRLVRRGGTDLSLFVLLSLLTVVPPVLTFLASRTLPQSVWAERQLTFVAAPFAVFIAASLCRLPRPAVRVAPVCCLAWAAAAGLMAFNAGPPKVAWDRLVADMIQSEPLETASVPVYAADAHVAWCLQFYLDEARETRFRIVTARQPIGERFWFAYREMQPGAGQLRLDRLTADGYILGPVCRARTAWQTAAVLPVRRLIGGEEAENPTTTEKQP